MASHLDGKCRRRTQHRPAPTTATMSMSKGKARARCARLVTHCEKPPLVRDITMPVYLPADSHWARWPQHPPDLLRVHRGSYSCADPLYVPHCSSDRSPDGQVPCGRPRTWRHLKWKKRWCASIPFRASAGHSHCPLGKALPMRNSV